MWNSWSSLKELGKSVASVLEESVEQAESYVMAINQDGRLAATEEGDQQTQHDGEGLHGEAGVPRSEEPITAGWQLSDDHADLTVADLATSMPPEARPPRAPDYGQPVRLQQQINVLRAQLAAKVDEVATLSYQNTKLHAAQILVDEEREQLTRHRISMQAEKDATIAELSAKVVNLTDQLAVQTAQVTDATGNLDACMQALAECRKDYDHSLEEVVMLKEQNAVLRAVIKQQNAASADVQTSAVGVQLAQVEQDKAVVALQAQLRDVEAQCTALREQAAQAHAAEAFARSLEERLSVLEESKSQLLRQHVDAMQQLRTEHSADIEAIQRKWHLADDEKSQAITQLADAREAVAALSTQLRDGQLKPSPASASVKSERDFKRGRGSGAEAERLREQLKSSQEDLESARQSREASAAEVARLTDCLNASQAKLEAAQVAAEASAAQVQILTQRLSSKEEELTNAQQLQAGSAVEVVHLTDRLNASQAKLEAAQVAAAASCAELQQLRERLTLKESELKSADDFRETAVAETARLTDRLGASQSNSEAATVAAEASAAQVQILTQRLSSKEEELQNVRQSSEGYCAAVAHMTDLLAGSQHKAQVRQLAFERLEAELAANVQQSTASSAAHEALQIAREELAELRAQLKALHDAKAAREHSFEQELSSSATKIAYFENLVNQMSVSYDACQVQLHRATEGLAESKAASAEELVELQRQLAESRQQLGASEADRCDLRANAAALHAAQRASSLQEATLRQDLVALQADYETVLREAALREKDKEKVEFEADQVKRLTTAHAQQTRHLNTALAGIAAVNAELEQERLQHEAAQQQVELISKQCLDKDKNLRKLHEELSELQQRESVLQERVTDLQRQSPRGSGVSSTVHAALEEQFQSLQGQLSSALLQMATYTAAIKELNVSVEMERGARLKAENETERARNLAATSALQVTQLKDALADSRKQLHAPAETATLPGIGLSEVVVDTDLRTMNTRTRIGSARSPQDVDDGHSDKAAIIEYYRDCRSWRAITQKFRAVTSIAVSDLRHKDASTIATHPVPALALYATLLHLIVLKCLVM
jgi:chromosome segregation ATPase